MQERALIAYPYRKGYPAGLYQMGELQARSRVFMGTSSDILMPKRFWS